MASTSRGLAPTIIPLSQPEQPRQFQRLDAASDEKEDDESDNTESESEGDLIDQQFGLQKKAATEDHAAELFRPVQDEGQPLTPEQRSYLEPRFGRDFSSVRVHTTASADASAKALGAVAYTSGNHIVFRAGEYSPALPRGNWLLAHELTHVAQQGHAPATNVDAAAVTPQFSPAPQQLADTSRPIKETISSEYAKSLNNEELDTAIRLTQQAFDAQGTSSWYSFSLLANLNTLRGEQFSRANSSQKPTEPAASQEEETDFEFTEAEFDVDADDWKPPEPTSGIIRGDPVRFRKAPSDAAPFEEVRINTKIVVLSSIGSWSEVQLEDGRKGWVASKFVETALPDPDATLHIIQKGETAQEIARKHYGPHAKEWGQDERFFVNVLYYTNESAAKQSNKQNIGITRPPDKQDDWDATKVVAGERIWIPGTAFALSLKGIVSSGSLTYETWQSIKNFFIGAAGFVSGLLVGALESVVDVFVGLWDMVKMAWGIIKSLFTGEIISDVKKLWDELSKLTMDDIMNAAGEWLKNQWFAEGTWGRWYNRGKLVGYAIVEILMLIFSDGLITAAKWAAKVAKLGKLAEILKKIPTISKMIDKAKKLSGAAVDAVRVGTKALSKAHAWAQSMLRIPLEIIKDTSAEALERLKKLSAWAKEKLRHLNPLAMKAALGCASPCKVDIAEIEKYLKNLAAKGAKVGARLGGDLEKILASLPADKLNLSLIRKKLKTRPALRKLIEAADLSAADMAKIADFATVGDLANPAQSYRTFVRYLTAVVPAKTEGDIGKLNKIAEAMMKTEAKASKKVNEAIVRQGSALKGSMFEGFAKLYLPELGGKEFARVTFKSGSALKLEKVQRTADNFVKATGEIWEIKHTVGKVPMDQVRDYQKIIGQLTPDGDKVKGVNYLFHTKEAAEANAHLKNAGFGVRYVSGNKMVPL